MEADGEKGKKPPNTSPFQAKILQQPAFISTGTEMWQGLLWDTAHRIWTQNTKSHEVQQMKRIYSIHIRCDGSTLINQLKSARLALLKVGWTSFVRKAMQNGITSLGKSLWPKQKQKQSVCKVVLEEYCSKYFIALLSKSPKFLKQTSVALESFCAQAWFFKNRF